MTVQERHSSGESTGLDVELFGLCPQWMHMPRVSLQNVLHSLGFPMQKMELKPCANGVSTVAGQILPCRLLSADQQPASCLSEQSLGIPGRTHSAVPSLSRTATGLERHLCASKITPFPQAKTGCVPKTPIACLTKLGSSGREECVGDYVGCFSPGWPVSGFLETSGSVSLT